MSSKLKHAKKFASNMRRQITRLRLKSLINSDNEAAREMLTKLAEMNTGLRKLGFRTTDEDEPGSSGRIVPLTEEWIAMKRKARRKFERIRKKLHESPPTPEALEELMKALRDA